MEAVCGLVSKGGAMDTDKFVLQWASQRLQKVLGQDVSDVCEYLVAIEVRIPSRESI